MERLTKNDVKLGFVDSSTLPSYASIYERLREYEIAEEQGLLLKPKVALNSFVYWDSGYWGVIPYKVCNISYSIHGFCYEICAFKGDELLDDQEVVDDDFGKYVFLSKEEAEKKLAEMKGE